MRIIVIKQGTDLQALSTRLLDGKAGSERALERLKNLNPHVDFKRLGAGTVLLIPDAAGFRRNESRSIAGEAFDALRAELLASFEASAERVRSGFDAMQAEQKEVLAVLKSKALDRVIGTDPDLGKQIKAAVQGFKEDQQEMKTAADTLKALTKQAAAELATLAKLMA